MGSRERRWGWLPATLVGVTLYAAPSPIWADEGQAARPAAASADLNEADQLSISAAQAAGRGKHDEATALGERALAIRINALGPEHPKVVASLHDLAELYRAKGDFAAAAPLYRRALATCEKTFGTDAPELVKHLDAFARMYIDKGDDVNAAPLYRRILEIQEKAHGPHSSKVAAPLDDLARVYTERGDYDRAEPLYRRALEIQERASGPGSPATAVIVHNLATMYSRRGDYTQAEALYRRALTIREKTLGPNHPERTRTLNNLAELYRSDGDHARAEPLHLSVLAARARTLGPVHPLVAASLRNLAELYRSDGDHERAEPLYRRALAIHEKVSGPDHPSVADALDDLADLYRSKGESADVEQLLLRALAIREKALGPDHPDVVTTLHRLARIHGDRQIYARAEPLLLRALTIRERALGLDSPDVLVLIDAPVRAALMAGRQPGKPPAPDRIARAAALLSRRASELRAQRRYGEAIPQAERAAAILRRALGPDHPDVAAALHALAGLHGSAGDYARAEPLYQLALAIRERTLGLEHPQVAALLDGLAEVHLKRWDYARAEPLLSRALLLLEKTLGPDHPEVAGVLDHMTALHKGRGEYLRAEPLLERSLAIREKAFGPDHPEVARSLNNLGLLYHHRGDHARAEESYQRALRIRSQVLGPNHPDVAGTINDLALLHQDRGDHARAEELFHRALGIRGAALGPEHPDVAVVLNNLAVLYKTRGDYPSAEPLYLRALSIQEKALGADHPELAYTLNNLAALYSYMGPADRVEPLLQRALTIRRGALGPDHPDVAHTVNNLAVVCEGRGHYQRAEGLYQRAVTISQRALGSEHPLVASSMYGLAEFYRARGDDVRAEELLEKALAIREKALGADHPDVATALISLATLYARQGRAKAMRFMDRAALIEERHTATVLAFGSEEQKRRAIEVGGDMTDRLVSLHLNLAPSDPVAAQIALSAILRRKGRVLDTVTGSITALRGRLEQGDKALLDDLESAYTQLAAHAARGPEGSRLDEYRRRMEALERRRQYLEAELSRRTAHFRDTRSPVTLAEVQRAIPEGAALLEIFRYAPRDLGGQTYHPRYVAYVLHSEGEPRFAEVGDAPSIEKAAAAFREALADHDATHDPGPTARKLDQLVMQPVRELLGETRWVIVSPDGPLHLVPFAALVDEDGGYLVERYLFSYLTTGRDLLRLASTEPPRQPPLLLANPAFDGVRSPASERLASSDEAARHQRSVDLADLRVKPALGTEQEARAIGQIFPAARVMTGAQAIEGALKGARAPLFLHLATHGFFLPDQGSSPSGREDPLLRAGIALAGFNQRESGGEDGVLTALEVARLDLRGTRLAVLATCDSGVGDTISGEGVYGLRRALVLAGAETQVMSLWPVLSEPTRALMVAYYDKLKRGAGRSDAMREVQLEMLSRDETSHPNRWASFIVSGDWRALDGTRVMPRVPPSARGCACAHASGEGDGGGAGLGAVAVAAIAAARAARRRGPRTRRVSR